MVSPVSRIPSESKSTNAIQPDCQVSELSQLAGEFGSILHRLTVAFLFTASLRARNRDENKSLVLLLNCMSSRKSVSDGSATLINTPTTAKVISASVNVKPVYFAFMRHLNKTEKFIFS